MNQKVLSAKQNRAAVLVAEDELTDDAIAAEVGIGRTCLHKWKQVPEFRTAVKAHIAMLQEELSRYSVARKDRRLAFMERRYRALQQIMDERQGDSQVENEPGGTTGLITRHLGPGAIFPEFVLDPTILDAALKIERQAAQEVGQWLDRTDVTSGGKDAGQILLDLLERPVAITVSEDHNPFKERANADD